MMRWSISISLIFLVCMVASRRDKTERKLRQRHGPDKAMRDDSGGQCELEISCKGSDGTTPVKLPIRGPRGPSGNPGEPGRRGDPGEPGLPGHPGKSAANTVKVAFFVGLQENLGPVKKDTNIIFDRVVTNVGKAYDVKSGRFITPVNGTYDFIVTVAAQGRQKAAVKILRNGDMIATVWAESIPYWASATSNVLLQLKKGDQVWLQLLGRASYLHGYMYSTFTGHILFED